MRFKRRICHGAGNILSNHKSWQGERERCSLNCCKHWGKEWRIWDLGCRKLFFSEALSPEFIQFENVALQLVVSISSIRFSAKAGIHVGHEHCKSPSLPFSTWAIKDQCEPYCTHCDGERVNGDVFIEIFSPTLRWEKIIFFTETSLPVHLLTPAEWVCKTKEKKKKKKSSWEKSCGRPHKGRLYWLPLWKKTFLHLLFSLLSGKTF